MDLHVKDLGKVCLTCEGDYDKNKEYDTLVVVYDNETDASYISKKIVPVGINILDTEYWQPLCKHNGGGSTTYTINLVDLNNITIDTIVITNDKLTDRFKVLSNTSFTISKDVNNQYDFVNYSPQSGSNNTIISISCDKYDGRDDKSEVLIAKADADNNVNKRLTIIQKGKGIIINVISPEQNYTITEVVETIIKANTNISRVYYRLYTYSNGQYIPYNFKTDEYLKLYYNDIVLTSGNIIPNDPGKNNIFELDFKIKLNSSTIKDNNQFVLTISNNNINNINDAKETYNFNTIGEEEYLTINPTEQTVLDSGGQYNINVESNTIWKVEKA